MDKNEKQIDTVTEVQTPVTPDAPKVTIKTLNVLECLEIIKVPGVPKPYKYNGEESRYKGLEYNVFAYETFAFAVETNDAFNEMHKNGELGQVKLSIENGKASFLSAKSQKAMRNAQMAMFDAKRITTLTQAFTVEFVREKYTMEDLNELA